MKITHRKKTMDSFIKFWSKILIENPDFNMNFLSDSIYKNLTRWYDTEEELTHDNRSCGNFDEWINYFDKKDNIEVDIDKEWSYFIQFVNKKEELFEKNNLIKLYIPIDSSSIKDGVKTLFDFLVKENIAHISKIGKHTRFDNITIRVGSEEDAKKIMEFVNNCDQIKEGMLPPDPFAFSEEDIALAVDGNLSYTNTITEYISLYLTECKNNNTLEEANLDGFIEFIKQYYNTTFINKIDTSRIFKDFRTNSSNAANKANNLKEVTELFITSLNEDFTFEQFIEHFNKCNNFETVKKSKLEYFYTLVKDDVDENDIEELIAYTVNTMTQKMTIEEAINQLKNYIYVGNPAYISKVSGLRNYVVENDLRNKILIMLDKENITIEDYFEQMLPKNEVLIDEDPVIDEVLPIEDISTKTKEEYLISTIMETYEKFEKKYKQGEYEFSGEKHVSLALFQLLALNKYDGFTNTSGTRDELIENVSREDAIEIMMEALKYSKIDTEDRKIQELLSTEYTKYIIEETYKKEKNK